MCKNNVISGVLLVVLVGSAVAHAGSYKRAQANSVGNKPVAVEPSVKTLSNGLVKICITAAQVAMT